MTQRHRRREETAYAALSESYDALMADGRYEERADYIDRTLRRCAVPVETVLDLACGTGAVAWLLSRRGYRVTAVDNSEEMLTVAAGKADRLSGEAGQLTPPQFVRQSMTALRLAGPVDAAVCTLDALNYLLRERDLRHTFHRVARYLRPGGLFLFDVNTPCKLRRMNGQIYMDEAPGTFCVWRTFFSERSQICTYQVDLFRERQDGAWDRRFEEHQERAWTEEQLRRALDEAGFHRVRLTGDLTARPPVEDEDRWLFVAKKQKQGG